MISKWYGIWQLHLVLKQRKIQKLRMISLCKVLTGWFRRWMIKTYLSRQWFVFQIVSEATDDQLQETKPQLTGLLIILFKIQDLLMESKKELSEEFSKLANMTPVGQWSLVCSTVMQLGGLGQLSMLLKQYYVLVSKNHMSVQSQRLSICLWFGLPTWSLV